MILRRHVAMPRGTSTRYNIPIIGIRVPTKMHKMKLWKTPTRRDFVGENAKLYWKLTVETKYFFFLKSKQLNKLSGDTKK